MMTPRGVHDRLNSMAIFPLPRAVLLPSGVMPLFVFEDRYRRLVKDCLAGDRLMAIATLAERDGDALVGDPPIHRDLGIGRIEDFRQLEDGRFLIVVHGWIRARIIEEMTSPEPYRIVRAAPIADVGEARAMIAKMSVIKQLLLELSRHLTPSDETAGRLIPLCLAESDAGHLADLLGAALLDDHRLRQSFLQEANAERRLDQMTAMVAEAVGKVTTRLGSAGSS